MQCTHLAPVTRTRRCVLVNVVCFFLFLAGLGYLLYKSIDVSWSAGYDFKYLWVAGEAWVRGINPYSSEYVEIGRQLITQGHVPEMWVYPPSWGAICMSLAQIGLLPASFVWNVINIGLLLLASAFLVQAFQTLSSEVSPPLAQFTAVLRRPWRLFFLHVFAVAILEASAIVLSVGQTSILMYFGISVLLCGMVRENRTLATTGMVCLFLKPRNQQH